MCYMEYIEIQFICQSKTVKAYWYFRQVPQRTWMLHTFDARFLCAPLQLSSELWGQIANNPKAWKLSLFFAQDQMKPTLVDTYGRMFYIESLRDLCGLNAWHTWSIFILYSLGFLCLRNLMLLRKLLSDDCVDLFYLSIRNHCDASSVILHPGQSLS